MAEGEGTVRQCPKAVGSVRADFLPPGSKSLTQRWLLLAAVASGRSVIRQALRSDDVEALAEGLRVLGAGVAWSDATTLQVDGVGGRFPGSGALHAGEGGTPARFLMAAAALSKGACVIDGSERLRVRPMNDGADVLRLMGAEVRRTASTELPLQVTGAPAFAHGGDFEIDRPASSQFISAVALLAPWMERGLVMRVRGGAPSATYVHLTVQCLQRLGVAASWDGRTLEVPAGPPRGFDVTVEPDASSAAYGFALAAVLPGSRVRVPGLRLVSAQPDLGVVRALAEMGAEVGEDAVGCFVAAASLRGASIDASDWPDGALAVMAAAGAVDGVTELQGLETLAAKESDRIESMRAWLLAAGAEVERGPDWMRIGGPFRHRDPVEVKTHRDHRVAMSAAVAGAVRGELKVSDPSCVDKSWPGFWRAWADLLGS